MAFELALIAIALALPLATGFALARARPALPGFHAALVAAVPFLAAYLLFAWRLDASASGQGPSSLALPALLVFGAVAALMGFGLGFYGHSLGRRK